MRIGTKKKKIPTQKNRSWTQERLTERSGTEPKTHRLHNKFKKISNAFSTNSIMTLVQMFMVFYSLMCTIFMFSAVMLGAVLSPLAILTPWIVVYIRQHALHPLCHLLMLTRVVRARFMLFCWQHTHSIHSLVVPHFQEKPASSQMFVSILIFSKRDRLRLECNHAKHERMWDRESMIKCVFVIIRS